MGRGAAEIPPPAGGGYRRPLDCRGRGRAASDFSHPPLRGDARVLPLGLPAPGFEGGGPALLVPGGDPYLRRLPLARPPPALLIWRGDTILVRALSVRTERSASVHIDLDGQDGHGMLIGSAIAEAASIRWTISPRRTSPRCRHPVGTQVTLCCRSPQASASHGLTRPCANRQGDDVAGGASLYVAGLAPQDISTRLTPSNSVSGAVEGRRYRTANGEVCRAGTRDCPER
jgi:hypothetical protein